jgi:hypothetical protein
MNKKFVLFFVLVGRYLHERDGGQGRKSLKDRGKQGRARRDLKSFL